MSGRRVASGRLRVDAARAVDKLREYQLPDAALWVLEVVRAANALGATSIQVTGDADDVRVAWTGAAIDPSALPRLFDELVDPSPASERRALRLLATGVNTALGLEPRWIDVLTSIADGRAARARYGPRLLERAPDGSAPRLRELALEEVAAPPELTVGGSLVHLRRLPSLSAIGVLVGYGEPRELAIASRACDDIKTPTTVGRSAIGRGTSHRDLLRLRLPEPFDGFVAVMDPASAVDDAGLDLAEHDVLLARYSLPLPGLAETGASARGRVPLRAYLNAPRLPTNASRSAVRLDEPPVDDALVQIEAMLPALMERLVRELSPDDAEHEWTGTARERLRASAIAILSAHAAGRDFRARLTPEGPNATLPAWMRALALAPLLRDATGRPRTPASFASEARDGHVHYAEEPFGDDLAPWFGDVLWVPPGDPSRLLLGGLAAPDARTLLHRTRRFARKKETFLAAAKRAAELRRHRTHVLKIALVPGLRSKRSMVDAGPLALDGLEGELALLDASNPVSGSLRALVDGREIETVAFDSPVAFAAIAGTRELVPSLDYAGVWRNAAFDRLSRAVQAYVVIAAEALADLAYGSDEQRRRIEGKKSVEVYVDLGAWLTTEPDAVAGLLRRAVRLGLSQLGGTRDELLACKSTLLRAPIWPTVGGLTLSTHDVLRALGASTPPRLRFSSAGVRLAHVPPGSVVLELERGDVSGFSAVHKDLVSLDYSERCRALCREERDGIDPEERLLDRVRVAGGAALRIVDGELRAVAAFSASTSSLEVLHWGAAVHRTELETIAPVRFVVEDGTATPDPRLSRLAGEAPSYPIDEWTRRLVRAFVDAFEPGRAPAELTLEVEAPEAAHTAIRALVRALGAVDDLEGWLGLGRVDRLRRARIFPRLGRSERASLSELVEEYPSEIPYVGPNEPRVAGASDFAPLSIDDAARSAIVRLTDRPLVDVSDELERRRRYARRAEALERHLEKMQVDPSVGFAPPFIDVKGEGILRARAALGSRHGGAEIIVLIEGRAFSVVRHTDGFPLRVLVDLDERCADEDFTDLSKTGRRRVRFAVNEAARALLADAIAEDPTSLVEAGDRFELMLEWARARAKQKLNKREQALLRDLQKMPAFPSIQGPRIAIDDAVWKGSVRVATYDDRWLEPARGDAPSSYDSPILELPASERRAASLRELIELVCPQPLVVDVTKRVARLQSERRIGRGLTERPRLAQVADRRFCFPIEELLDPDSPARELLGIGEATLALDSHTRVTLAREGAEPIMLEMNLIPRLHVAALSPLGRRSLTETDRLALESATVELTSQVLRRVIDTVPHATLPDWLRAVLRESCLAGGGEFFDQVMDVPIFETTARVWVTPRAVKSDADRHSGVWFTTRPTHLVPLDEDRIALRIRPSEEVALGRWVKLVNGTRELELDDVARRNLRAPDVESLEPTPNEAAVAAAVLRIEPTDRDPLEGTIAVLRPGHASLKAVHVSRSRRPLGRLDAVGWPVVARLDHPGLTPDRTWSAPEQGELTRKIVDRVRSMTWAALADLVPFPRGPRFIKRVRAQTPKGVARVEGVAWLSSGEARSVTVDAGAGEREMADRATGLPVSARLWLAESFGSIELRDVIRGAYEDLIARVAERIRTRTVDDVDGALAELVRAKRLGVNPLDAQPEERTAPILKT
ncbi:MAG: hypothetical protein AB7P00_20690, partial [Sandaracinaceae bacterium]